MSNGTATLADVQRLFDEGKYLQALAGEEELGPLNSWRDPPARLLAGRLAARLGAPRLGHLLQYLAYRADPTNPMMQLFQGRVKLQRGRVLAAWRFVQSVEPCDDADSVDRGFWQLLHAEVLGILRDFQAADISLRRAHENLPNNSWYWCLHSRILAAQDDYESAWESAQKALAADPAHLPAIQTAAQTLGSLRRDAEAVDLLTSATNSLESGELFLQLGILQSELGEHEAARDMYEQAESCFPLLEPGLARTIAARRSDAAYFCGDLEEAARFAELAGTPFHARLLPRLTEAAPRKRVVLPVQFVQQHHVTCVPATLTAISKYWAMPADHLEIAEQICYDGTPTHSERQWAERNGFFALEFRLTWDNTVAIIDRKIPFILSTAMPGMGHAQAVIGYDTLRETLIIRDPSLRELTELFIEPFLQHQAASGPRAMVMVPVEERHQLEGIELAESRQYDCLYELQRILERHDRFGAQQVVDQLQSLAIDHRLSLLAQCTLASYDADPVRLLECTDRLISMYARDLKLVLSKLGILGELGRRQERIALLRGAMKSFGEHPVLLSCLAREFSVDAQRSEIVMHIVRRILKHYQPVDGQIFELLAQQLWQNGDRQRALELYRFIACFAERNEDAAKAYFSAARALGQTDTAREFLEDRILRFAAKSCGPAITLCWAYEQLGNVSGGLEVLEDAIQLRPGDSELLIFTAHYQAWHGNFERARTLLQTAKSQAHKGRWLRAATKLADLEDAPAAAIARCREILALEPLAADAHAMLAHHLAATEGVGAGLLHLRRAVRENPRSFALRSLLLDWIRAEGPNAVENTALEILEFQPADVRARCELSWALLSQGRIVEALKEVETAAKLEPSNPIVHFVRGQLHHTLDKRDDARQAFRQAIRLSVDYSPAIRALVQSCSDHTQQLEELQFVIEQLRQQSMLGDGLLTFRDCAIEVLESDELLKVLREANQVRPDLWHTWSALIRQLITAGELAGALDVAQEGVARFPLLPEMLVKLALVHRAFGNRARETGLLQRAHRADRACLEAGRQLAVSYRETGDVELAKQVLLQTAARHADDAGVLRQLSECFWQLGERTAALQKLTACLRRDPNDGQAWQRFAEWALVTNDAEDAIRLAKELSVQGGLIIADELIKHDSTNVRWWREKAQFLYHLNRYDDGLECLKHALNLNPRDEETHEDLATYLASLGQYEESLAACRSQEFADEVPLRLRFREAEILWHQGARETALVKLQQLAQQHPDYVPVCAVLTQWYSSQPASAEYFKTATQLTQLQPELAENWGHLGFAALHRGDSERALTALRKAVEIDPSYLYAGWTAFDLCLANRDAIAALDVIDKILPFIRYEELLAARTRIAALERNRQAATANFRELCRLPRTDVSTAWNAANAMFENRWQPLVQLIVEEEIENRRAGPAVGHIWTMVLGQQEGWQPCLQRLAGWTGDRAVWESASCCFLEMASAANDETPINRFLKQQRSQLRESAQTWACVGRSLAEIGRFGKAVAWFSDWNSRPDTSPWMLLPLTISMLELQRYPDAAGVSRHALQLPADASSALHALWVTFEEAVTGQVAEAAAHLQQLPIEAVGESAFYAALHALTTVLIDSQLPASVADGPASFRSSKLGLRQAIARFPKGERRRLRRRLHHRCLRRLAETHERPLSARWHAVMAHM